MPDFHTIRAKALVEDIVREVPREVWNYPERTLTHFDASIIWNYPRRTLTEFDGSWIWNYHTRTLTNLNADIIWSYPNRTLTGFNAEWVWNHPERTLTRIVGQPRIDLLGEDSSLETGTGTRKQLIDRISKLFAFDATIEGSLTLDGTERNIVEDVLPGNPPRYLEGVIDLSPLASGDTVTIRYYVRITEGGVWLKYAEETYTGAQTLPALYITTVPCRYGVRITAQQTAGTYRTLRYCFFRKRIL